MSAAAPRPLDSFSLWLGAAAGASIVAALISAPRAKPPAIFALGFGLALGIVLRILATSLSVERTRRVVLLSAALAGAGMILSFVPSYRRAARDWESLAATQPTDPLAAAILSQMAKDDPAAAAPPKFSVGRYLSRRYAAWPSPWPGVLFGAEWMGCVLMAAAGVGIHQSRERERPVAHARGSDMESS